MKNFLTKYKLKKIGVGLTVALVIIASGITIFNEIEFRMGLGFWDDDYYEETSDEDLSVQKSEGLPHLEPWLSLVGSIWCYHEDMGWYGGSGTLMSGMYEEHGEDAVLYSAAHVLTAEEDISKDVFEMPPEYCEVYFPGYEDPVTVEGDKVVFSETADAAILRIDNSLLDESLLAKAKLEKDMLCDDLPLGSEIAVLGYPDYGSTETITVTNGIISGTEGPTYYTDAKIDVGNSGGGAIHVDTGCYVGMPMVVYYGDAESLGMILRWDEMGL